MALELLMDKYTKNSEDTIILQNNNLLGHNSKRVKLNCREANIEETGQITISDLLDVCKRRSASNYVIDMINGIDKKDITKRFVTSFIGTEKDLDKKIKKSSVLLHYSVKDSMIEFKISK